MDKLLDGIVKLLNNNNIINRKNEEIIRYGMELLILKIIFFLSSILVGILLNSFIQSFVFMLFFIPLRSYAGGYHAESKIRCFIQSILLISIVLLLNKAVFMSQYFSIILLMFVALSIFAIWRLAPIDAKNKPLDDTEIKIYRKRTRIILAIEVSILIILMLLYLKNIAYIIGFAIISEAFLIVMQYIKTRKNITTKP